MRFLLFLFCISFLLLNLHSRAFAQAPPPQVLPEKAGRLYAGPANPVRIPGRDSSWEASLQQGEIRHLEADRWEIQAAEVGLFLLRLHKGEMVQELPVEMFPLPEPVFHLSRGPQGAGAEVQGLYAIPPSQIDFEDSYRVERFRLRILDEADRELGSFRNEGEVFPERVRKLLGRAPDARLLVEQLQVRYPDGRLREMPLLVFSL